MQVYRSRVGRDLLADRRQPRLRALPVGLLQRWRHHVLGDRVARPELTAGIEERGRAGLPGGTACGLVRGELVLQVVVDVDAPHTRGGLRVKNPQLSAGEIDVLAVQRA